MLFILSFIVLKAFGQNFETSDPMSNPKLQVINNDTFYISNLPPVYIYPPTELKDRKELFRYQRLVYNVRKVYPYAILAKNKLESINTELEKLNSEKERKIYLDKAENELRVQFEEELKNLTITQGKILIKLIDRETGNTTYTWVKELRGSFQAFFWQSIARLVGSNLKVKYEPLGDDKAIEEIIVMIETGQI